VDKEEDFALFFAVVVMESRAGGTYLTSSSEWTIAPSTSSKLTIGAMEELGKAEVDEEDSLFFAVVDMIMIAPNHFYVHAYCT
jgi:hypothetical protein